MKLKFVKLIRVPITVELSDGSTRDGYRYMDIDGNILAESLKGEVYPSAIRELEMEVKLEAKQKQEIREVKAKTEQEAQAEWDAMREQMRKDLQKKGRQIWYHFLKSHSCDSSQSSTGKPKTAAIRYSPRDRKKCNFFLFWLGRKRLTLKKLQTRKSRREKNPIKSQGSRNSTGVA